MLETVGPIAFYGLRSIELVRAPATASVSRPQFGRYYAPARTAEKSSRVNQEEPEKGGTRFRFGVWASAVKAAESLTQVFVANFTAGEWARMKNTNVSVLIRELPETINIHLTRRCNFGCRFCYAQFAECEQGAMRPEELKSLIEAIGRAGPSARGRRRKINFAGGEPLLYPGLPGFVALCKDVNLISSVVTNGSLLNARMVGRLRGALDICALSIDSARGETNSRSGRCGGGLVLGAKDYRDVAALVQAAGIRLKVNTVVHRLNAGEMLGELIAEIAPFRWKLFQVKRIEGQNGESFDELAVTVAEFREFVERNRRCVPSHVAVVPETADEMTDSYAMIAPNGCFFDNSQGRYSYSRPILAAGLMEAFQDVHFRGEKFVSRGGLYE